MTENTLSPRTLKGFRDLLPAEALIKERMLEKIKRVFFSFGYTPIETPHLEYTELLIGETGGDIAKQLYRFNDQGGRDVCLRFDLTVPFARFVVQHKGELGMPFKRFAIGNVFRGEQPQFGRYREFTQCDFDFVGIDAITADAEIIEVIAAILQGLGIPDFTVRINNRRIMNGLAAALGAGAKAADMLRVLDKLDKIGPQAVHAGLCGEAGLDPRAAEEVLRFAALSQEGDPAAVFERAAPYRARHEMLAAGLDELERLMAVIRGAGISADHARVDFTIARGLGYYTGIVYETVLRQLPEIGSVCSGGRYDNLTMNFSAEKLPGVGASVGLDRLIAALQKLGLMNAENTPAELLIAVMSEQDVPQIRRIAAELRSRGLAVEVYPEAAKLKKQFQYADRKGHPYVAVLGEQELKAGTFTLKDMRGGTQTTCESLEALAAALLLHRGAE